MPEIVGDESVGIKYAINGLLSLTPDGLPILGETPEVKGLWSAAAVWVKEGPGVGKSVAEWMVLGQPEIDLQSSDIARFYPCQQTRRARAARAAEGFNKTYGIVHPAEQWESNRGVRLSPFYEREQRARRGLLRDRGLGAPALVRVERQAARRVRRSRQAARGRVGVALVVADHQRRAPGDARARRDVRPDGVLRSSTSSARARSRACSASRCAQMDVAVGKVVYTPVLTPGGGFRSDLTIMRLGDEHFRVVTGGAHGMADLKWFADNLPADGTAQIVDLTSAWCTLGLWGPRARDILAAVTVGRRLARGFALRHVPRRSRSARCRCSPRGSRTSASSAGSCTCRSSRARASGTSSGRRVSEHGVVPAGIGVYGTTGRRREVLPRVRLRARRRLRRRRGRA